MQARLRAGQRRVALFVAQMEHRDCVHNALRGWVHGPQG